MNDEIKRTAEILMRIHDAQPRHVRDQINSGELQFMLDERRQLWLVPVPKNKDETP
jgi:hypothetical protein